MIKIKGLIDKYYILLMVVGCLPAVAALVVPGYFGASDDIHIAWLGLFDQTVKIGQLPPRYVPGLSYGFGYPLFNFVFPLPFYLAEIFVLLGFGLVGSVKMLLLVSVVASGLCMYKFLRALVEPELALAGAFIYVYTPYRATEIYVRGAFGESLSFVFLPLLFLGWVKVLQGEARKGICLLALALGLLVMTHNIVSYMFFGFLLLAVLVVRKKLPSLILAIVLGLVSSAFFWLPALIDSNLMKYDTVFSYFDHFPTLKQLVTPHFGYGASVPGPWDGMSFFLGTVNIGLVVIGSALILKNIKKSTDLKRNFLLFSLIAFFISIFMMNFRSSFVWDSLPFLAYFQFPWRFLTATTFLSAGAVVALSYVKWSKVFALLSIPLVIALNYSYFKPQDNLGRDDGYYLNRYTALGAISSEYRQTSEEYLRLPKSAEVRPDKMYNAFFGEGLNITRLEQQNFLEAKAVVGSPGGVVSANKYAFPGWQVEIDGKRVETVPGKPFGQIAFSVPPGEHTLHYYYNEPVYKLVLDIISFGTLLILVVVLAKSS